MDTVLRASLIVDVLQMDTILYCSRRVALRIRNPESTLVRTELSIIQIVRSKSEIVELISFNLNYYVTIILYNIIIM